MVITAIKIKNSAISSNIKAVGAENEGRLKDARRLFKGFKEVSLYFLKIEAVSVVEGDDPVVF